VFRLDTEISGAAIPQLRQFGASINSHEAKDKMGEDLAALWAEQLRAQASDPRAKYPIPGASSTGYWGAAAHSTYYDVDLDGIFVGNTQIGLEFRYLGGTITPRNKRYLTIPASPESVGKRAGEFDNLKFARVMNPNYGRVMNALVIGLSPSNPRVKRVKSFKGLAYQPGMSTPQVMYWLFRSATQAARPEVMPTMRQIGDTAANAMEDFLASQGGVNS